MSIDAVKGTVTYVTAGVALIASMVMAYLAWSSDDNGRDIAILFGFLGLIVGAVLSFLFGSENATRATRATERITENAVAQTIAARDNTRTIER